MFNIRKVITAGVVATVLAGSLIATSTTPASALWLVRGMPLHVGVVHYRRPIYGYHIAYRHVYRGFYRHSFRRNFFFPGCFGAYGPVC